MKKLKTNLMIGLVATGFGLAIEQLKYLVNEYDLVSAVLALIITFIACVGFAYLMDILSYIAKKIGGRK